MPTTIKLKNSVTTTNAPSSLAQGEVAINVTDKKVWVGNAATTPVQLLGGGADGAFTNISVSSIATFGAGTVSAPSITTTGDTNTGIFFPAADTIAFAEGGVEAMRINSSAFVGVNTNNPLTPFHVVGTIQSQRVGAAQYAGMLNSGGVATFFNNNQASSSYVGFEFQGISTASATPVTYAVISGSGNLGINTNSPSFKLDALSSGNTQVARFRTGGTGSTDIVAFERQTSDVRAVIKYDGTDGTMTYGTSTGHPIAFCTGNVERMRIDTSGNVLIGQTSLINTERLLVRDNAAQSVNIIVRNDSTSASAGSAIALNASGNVWGIECGSSAKNSNALTWIIDYKGTNVERMRLNTDGTFMFNSGYGSVANAYGCRAWVNFNGTGTVAIRQSGNVSSITDNGVGLYTVNFSTSLTDANFSVTSTSANGGQTVTANAYSTSSVALRVNVPTVGDADSEFVSVIVIR